MSIPTIGPEGGAGDSGAERPRTRKGNKAALVAAIIIGLFALVGVVGTIVVITLAVTGQL